MYISISSINEVKDIRYKLEDFEWMRKKPRMATRKWFIRKATSNCNGSLQKEHKTTDQLLGWYLYLQFTDLLFCASFAQYDPSIDLISSGLYSNRIKETRDGQFVRSITNFGVCISSPISIGHKSCWIT